MPISGINNVHYSSKSVHLATVELCTSSSQKADREGHEISFLLGGKKVFFYWFEWTLPPHATH
jgi:hypothetical protein